MILVEIFSKIFFKIIFIGMFLKILPFENNPLAIWYNDEAHITYVDLVFNGVVEICYMYRT